MAKAPWARFATPSRPIVTDRPTEITYSTIAYAVPVKSMLSASSDQLTARRRSLLRNRVTPDHCGLKVFHGSFTPGIVSMISFAGFPPLVVTRMM